MLNKARSLFSRVFSIENRSSQSKETAFFDDYPENSDDSCTSSDYDSESDDCSQQMKNNKHNETTFQSSDNIKTVKSVKESSLKSNQSVGTKSQSTSAVSDQRSSISTMFNSVVSKSSLHQLRTFTETVENNIDDKTSYLVVLNRKERKQNRLTSAMNIAFTRGNVESMKRLLSNFDIDINQQDSYGMSYLEHSILLGSYDMVDLLIRYGCDLYRGDSHGHSYLYVAIKTSSNKNDNIIKLLLENDCSCLRAIDIVSLVSVDNVLHIDSHDFIQLYRHILLIMTYHLKRMPLNDVISLMTYMISTGILLCKNDDIYALSLCNKQIIEQFNNDYIQLFIKVLGSKHALKLEQKLRSIVVQQQTLISVGLIELVFNDIQTYIVKIYDMIKQPNKLKHFCRLIIRENLKSLKGSTLNSLGYSTKLQNYLLYSPI
ncbi:unnamed protein product [Didymodactylos carnosus]|uniref:SOCS box domain-containing protein n=2 Tax=Didymodactylos carnosus TaxID=1234261 RepID=A0A8S2HHS3_9BILA|nr:unnamed protein product [Didymodactylos carnosus]CAF3646153.1 unnamed protein product [Didymodactylos carnosus]